MAATLDLKRLAIDRTAAPAGRIVRRRHIMTRFVVPFAVLAGFVVLIAWSVRETLLPAKTVTVVPVVVARAEIQQAGTPLFQAAGWIEPRPGAVIVSALAEGVVEQLLVVEGQEVQQGQAVAKLTDVDARLALDQAVAELRLKKAELVQARAAAAAAQTNLQQPLHLQAALAEAASTLARAKTELKNLPYATRAAESRVLLAKQDFEGKESAGDAVSGRAIQRSKSELDSAQAALEEVRAKQTGLKDEAKALEDRRDALAKQLELKTEETRKLAEADALVEAAEAKLSQGEVAVQTARLRLERMVVKAPMAGRVLSINARPGKRLMGIAPASELDAATVLTLYDPQMLQVRADVRLEDIPRAAIGGPVQIETAAAGKPILGEVIGVTALADIQKNTLQVKVAIKSPPSVIKPEMLAQVTFLAPESSRDKSKPTEQPLRMLIPRELVVTDEGGTHVWVADRHRGAARKQSIVLGRAGTEELVEVSSGVTEADKLIAGGREGLADGERIQVSGQDSTIGKQSRRTALAPADGSATK